MNEQLQAVASEMKRAITTADDSVSALLEKQLAIIGDEFERQCGQDDDGQLPEECTLEPQNEPTADDADSNEEDEENAEDAGSADSGPKNRRDQLAGVQQVLLDAVARPDVPRGHDEETDGLTRREYQTQLLTGLYAATCPVAGYPNASLIEVAEEMSETGSALTKEEIEIVSATLDSVYGAIQAVGLALAVADGTYASAIRKAGDDARATRDLLTELHKTASDADKKDAPAPYVPPLGFSLNAPAEQPRTSEQAPKFVHAAVGVPLTQLRQLAGQAKDSGTRLLCAETAGVLARAQGKLELSQKIAPSSISIRGGRQSLARPSRRLDRRPGSTI